MTSLSLPEKLPIFTYTREMFAAYLDSEEGKEKLKVIVDDKIERKRVYGK
jgi:hypothetical protein